MCFITLAGPCCDAASYPELQLQVLAHRQVTDTARLELLPERLRGLF